MTRFYEITYLVSPDLAEAEINGLKQKISDFIVQEKGAVNRASEPQKKQLGYAIKKKTEGFMVVLTITLDPKSLPGLEKMLKEQDSILRYLVISQKTLEKPIPKPPRRMPERIPVKEALEETKEPLVRVPERKKIELKEIDERIEEILKE